MKVSELIEQLKNLNEDLNIEGYIVAIKDDIINNEQNKLVIHHLDEEPPMEIYTKS